MSEDIEVQKARARKKYRERNGLRTRTIEVSEENWELWTKLSLHFGSKNKVLEEALKELQILI